MIYIILSYKVSKYNAQYCEFLSKCYDVNIVQIHCRIFYIFRFVSINSNSIIHINFVLV